MVASAPRIPPRLLDEIARLSRRRVPIAEINRLAGGAAARMRLHKPSYEQVRVLVHAARRLRRALGRTASTVAPDVAFGTMTSWQLLDRLWAPASETRDRAPPTASPAVSAGAVSSRAAA